ncbi:MAG: TonB family protein, partial [Candidatus Omnitrophica bacterium]|nr:TonB family protein [Candidatus Omnitrophota bacterium]
EGETTLTVVDDFGKRNYAVKIYKEDLEKLKERVDILLDAAGFDTLQTRIGDKERKIFIIGSLPASKQSVFESRMASVKDKIVNLVEMRDDVPSIEVDVEVMEIEKTALDNLGLQWNKTIAFSEGSTVPDKFQFDNLLNPTKTLKILSDWRTGAFTATLNFLKSNNKARTLSRPKIVCLSGKEASLLVGGERPIIKSSTTTTSTTGGSTTDYEIELKEYGIKLSIKPTVKENNEIQIELKTDITEIDDTEALQLTSIVSTPGLKKRSAQTELTVIDGQTVFLAGLIKSKREDDRDSVAGFGSIPIIGALFRHKDLSQTDTEVVITLTPTILGNKKSLQSVSAKTSKADAKNIEANVYTEPKIVYSEEDPAVKYSRLIQNIINSNISYPKELKDKSYEGTVKISLHLLPTGELLGAVTIQSSGSQVLDEAAEKAVKKLAPFPGFPPQLQLKELWLDIPIVYGSQKT